MQKGNTLADSMAAEKEAVGGGYHMVFIFESLRNKQENAKKQELKSELDASCCVPQRSAMLLGLGSVLFFVSALEIRAACPGDCA